jgi:uncharacterized protein
VLVSDAARPGAVTDVVTHTAGEALAYSIVFFAILRVHEPDSSIRQVLALRAPSVLAAVLAIVAGVALAIPSDFVEKAISARSPPSQKELDFVERLYATPTMGKKALLVITLVVIAPIADELFFRGAIFTPLKRGRRLEPVVMAVAAYETIANLNPRTMLPFFVTVLVFTWIRGTTGSIIPSILGRIGYYAMGTLPLAMGKVLPKASKAIVAGSLGIAVLSLLAIAALSRRDQRTLDARLEDG